jgi:hypothetical protein
MKPATLLGMMVLVAVSGCTPPNHNVRSPERIDGDVVFRYYAPGARVVQVAGSWDSNTFLRGRDWTTDTVVGRMDDPDRDGVWELRVPLGPGRYEYLYLVDGRFRQLDPTNPQRVPDEEGGERSLLVIP